MVQAKIINGRIALQVTDPNFEVDLARVRAINGRSYDPTAKLWFVPLYSLGDLRARLPEVHLDIPIPTPIKPIYIDQPADIALPLFPYQQQDVATLRMMKSAILAHDPGSGKTAIAIGAVSPHLPALVVCPASAKYLWAEEIKRCRPEDTIFIADGRHGEILWADWTICSYDILASRLAGMKRRGIISLVGDECHLIKNAKSKRSKAFLELAGETDRVLCVTGTPMLQRPIELYPLLVACKQFHGNVHQYAHQFCGACLKNVWTRGGKRKVWDYSGATNLPQLSAMLKPIMLRRTKAEVLPYLPPKVHTPTVIDIENISEYLAEHKSVVEWLMKKREVNHTTMLVRFNDLRQISALGKVPAAEEHIRGRIESGHPVVVFSTFLHPLHILHKKFSSILIEGAVSTVSRKDGISKREEEIRKFQRGDRQVALVSMGTGGLSINLSVADTAIYLDLPWVPGTLTQSLDRLHRYGQKSSVQAIYLLGKGTIDEKMAQVLLFKAGVVGEVMGEMSQRELLEAICENIRM